MTNVRTYTDAERFLNAQPALESNEAANSLMLGVCGLLARHPNRIKAAPCLKTVEDKNGLVLSAMMTPPHNLVVFGYQGDLDGGARALVEDLAREGWQVPGVLGPSEVARKVAERWAKLTRQGYGLKQRQKVYELREVISPAPERGRLRQATEADVALVSQWWVEFHVSIFGRASADEADRAVRFRIGEGDIYLWEEDGQPVSMAMKTRPTRRGISIGSVYTPPHLRGNGYATACVGELSRMLLETGRDFCALFADVSNDPANRVYAKIGYKPVCDYDEYSFFEERSFEER